MKTKNIQVPLIHLNGTAAESLLEAIENAHAAIGDALHKMREVAPNGRDYYPLGPEALTRAIREHRERCHALDQVRTELEAMALGITDRVLTVDVRVNELHHD